jgi:hypothetical protein
MSRFVFEADPAQFEHQVPPLRQNREERSSCASPHRWNIFGREVHRLATFAHYRSVYVNAEASRVNSNRHHDDGSEQ